MDNRDAYRRREAACFGVPASTAYGPGMLIQGTCQEHFTHSVLENDEGTYCKIIHIRLNGWFCTLRGSL